MSAHLFRPGLYVGCTRAQHVRLGVHAGINARGGQLWRNSTDDQQEIERMRDALDLRAWLERRYICRMFRSRWFRRRLSHLLYEDEE